MVLAIWTLKTHQKLNNVMFDTIRYKLILVPTQCEGFAGLILSTPRFANNQDWPAIVRMVKSNLNTLNNVLVSPVSENAT